MSKKYWLLDAGHGGIKDGKYVTAPVKMFVFEDGFTIYEGVIVRAISTILQKMLCEAEIEHALVYDEVEDTSLSSRSAIANAVYVKKPNTVLLSIHCNAGGGKGIEIFTSIGVTEADPMAEVFYRNTIKYLPQFNFRPDNSDGDHDKEERFHMVGYEKNGKRVEQAEKRREGDEHDIFDYREAVRKVNQLGAGAVKTALEGRLATLKATLDSEIEWRVIINHTIGAVTSTGNINDQSIC